MFVKGVTNSVLSRNSPRTLKTMTHLEKLFYNHKIDIYRLPLGKNQYLWCLFGNTRCQGNLAFCKSKNCDQLRGDISLFKIFNLCQFYSPLLGFIWFVPDLIEIDELFERLFCLPFRSQFSGFVRQSMTTI